LDLHPARGQWDQWAGGSGPVWNKAIWPCRGATETEDFGRGWAMIPFCLLLFAKGILLLLFDRNYSVLLSDDLGGLDFVVFKNSACLRHNSL
jgi:hypothetical protein